MGHQNETGEWRAAIITKVLAPDDGDILGGFCIDGTDSFVLLAHEGQRVENAEAAALAVVRGDKFSSDVAAALSGVLHDPAWSTDRTLILIHLGGDDLSEAWRTLICSAGDELGNVFNQRAALMSSVGTAEKQNLNTCVKVLASSCNGKDPGTFRPTLAKLLLAAAEWWNEGHTTDCENSPVRRASVRGEGIGGKLGAPAQPIRTESILIAEVIHHLSTPFATFFIALENFVDGVWTWDQLQDNARMWIRGIRDLRPILLGEGDSEWLRAKGGQPLSKTLGEPVLKVIREMLDRPEGEAFRQLERALSGRVSDEQAVRAILKKCSVCEMRSWWREVRQSVETSGKPGKIQTGTRSVEPI
jgi:hypothetical protein